MPSRLWYMNADFEAELAHTSDTYRLLPFFESLNRSLAPRLLWLAEPGDALLLEGPWPDSLKEDAHVRGVELVSMAATVPQSNRVFTPWGWTPRATAIGERTGAILEPIPIDVVARVNSKLWSFELEKLLGVAMPAAAVCSSFEELADAVSRACPSANDKWVVKSPYGFAARDRVLGRGPIVGEPQAKWCRRRLASGETLIFQPWLDVIREYGVVMEISPDGSQGMKGISDLQTNGAGTATGYLLGRPPVPERARELERIASIVSDHLFKEGYHGPVGLDAIEHAGGLHPLLEINARYTMGFVAVAVERRLRPTGPTLWSLKDG